MQSSPLPHVRGGKILARKPAAKQVARTSGKRSNIREPLGVRPVPCEDGSTCRIELDLPRGAAEAGALKAELEPADAGE